ncbi:MaoC/PaaZ C-terminal domain-containing protein [Nocardia jinanensis]|uniref:MaoC-like dehydratase n=1 Tax=Nocardia jinanensis TaxID=382504 RepID=A0A917VV50_9NOCA|nr:MaoC/PaaZ C-terminal domain-containing protein [Nocardia jinanensis]GGL17121.1 MaoC-like dehydratase [Nocardia jinanensis]
MTRPPLPLSAGQNLGTRTIGPITRTDIIRFAGAGGDFNPLHHDPEYALRAGLPGVISMGQMQAGMLAAWLTDVVHVEHLLTYAVRFASPLAVGEALELTGRVESVLGDIAETTLTASVADRVVVSATARVRISPTT